MRLTWFPYLLGASLLVSACGQAPVSAAVSATSPAAVAAETNVMPTDTASSKPSADAVVPTSGPATCEVAPNIPVLDPQTAAKIPPVTEDDWFLGKKDAKVTIMEYSDYQCPYCAQLSPVMKAFIERNAGDVRLVYRHFPLPGHGLSLLATQAAESAGLQGKFWEMHDVIFENQISWTELDEAAFKPWLIEKAEGIGLDVAQFTNDLSSQAMMDKALKAQVDAMTAEITQTPFLLLNGIPANVGDENQLQMLVDLMKADFKEYAECPPFTVDTTKKYSAIINTEKGDITITLLPEKAPWAVNSFIFLAKSGWYDNVSFYHVLPGVVALSGDPSNSGKGGPGYAYSQELSGMKFDKAGLVGMMSNSQQKNSSRFFITMDKIPDVDGKYTIFGEVTEGLDIVKSLTPRDPQNPTENMPVGDKILGITITEN